ncbi:Phosphatidylinositol phosphatase PTPRQ [Geodia barretti]|uniref:Phosphatidylinositol phosphatase PTPRQ n=1 Tax=Geodia barretti TaxID=519541 RepID=A0AA35R3W2_GEOBA|nr:Phosphatidylinositol phosphatase PTPRQ [Geodia barretti]
MATGGGSPVAAASNGKTSQLLLLSILTLSLYTRVGDCNASGSGSSLMNPVSGLTLSVDEGSNTVIVSWTDNSLITMSYFVNYTATVGSTEIDSASDAVTTSDTDASWTATHNITGAFVQSGVNITVSVEAVVDDQLCDPAFASLLVPGEFSPSPEEFTVSGPTSTSLTLSWTVPFSQVTPNSFSISYTVDKLTGTPPAIPSGSLSIAINDTDLDTADNANFSYVLGGLTAYTEYTFNLSSLYGASTSSVVSATGTTSEALSGPVEGLSAGITNDSSSDSFSVSISWSEPSEPNGVILQYNYTVSSTDTNTAIVSGSTGNTSVVESMLTVIEPFTNYTVGVVAFNSAGEGQESSVTVESPQTAPGPVGDLQASFDETGSMFDSMTREYTLNLDIVWSEPPMQNGVITSYSVTVYQTNDLSDIVYSNDTLIAPNVTASVMVLAFTNYTVSVAASTSAGQGDESTVTVESPEAEPGPVGDLGASFVETTAMFDSMDNMWTIDIDITWEEPVNPNGVITAYNVTVYQTDDLSDIVYSNDTLTTPNVTASVEVPAYTDYTVSVAASTSAGQGDEATVSITSPEAAPGRVGNLAASFSSPMYDPTTQILTDDITITWTQPMYPNGVIQTYSVTVFETANTSNMVYNDSTLIDPNVTTSVIVLPFTDYTVSVAASTSAGQGEEETVTLTSPEAVPGQVESLNGSFISSGAVFDSDSRMYDLTLEVEWDEPTYPNGIIVSYNVTVFRTANSSDAVFSDESLMVTSATPSVMVLPFTNYTVSVAASTSAGQGDENSVTIESPEAVPGPVVGLDSTFSTTERSYEPTTRTYTVDLSITWGEPQYPNGVITLYQVIVTQFDDTTVEVYRNSGIEAPNVTASVMVLAFTDYTVSVAASTSAGQGDNVTDTVTAPEAAPEMVENLDAAFVSDGSVFNSMNNMWTIDIDITWEEPVNPNGVITAYNVTVYKTDDLSDIVYSNDAVTDTSVTASVEVPAYTDYTVSVAASTSAGQGEEATVNITSPEAAPSQVESLTAEFGESISFNPGSRMHNVTLNISWSQPLYPNGDILSYEVIVTQTSDPSVVIYGENVTDTEVMPSVMVLPFTDYTVSVAASTSAGQGDEDTVTVESPEAAPSQVRELSAEFVFVESDFNSTARMWDLDISITWTQPMYPNGQIDSYNVTVYETAAASNVVYSNDAVTDTSVTAPVEVPAYTDYTVSVAASTSAGQGDESTVTIISPEAAPGRVGNLAASFSSPMYDPTTQILTADITITWTQPMYPNGVIQTYNVTVFETANPSNMVYSDDTLIDPNVTTSVVALPFTNYTVSVAASTSAGQGEEDTVTVESPEAAPSAPREVMAEALTSTSITGYRVTHFVTESSDSPVDRDVPRDQLSLDIPSLTPFTNYTVYVEAETVAAVGEKSDDATVVTWKTPPRFQGMWLPLQSMPHQSE